MTLDDIRAFLDTLEASGLVRVPLQWGITESALLRDVPGGAVRRIEGSDTDTVLTEYHLADGSPLWRVHLRGPDDRDGVAWFTNDFMMGPPAVRDRAEAIEAWLRANPDAYDLFVPILWSAAPDAAREAKQWLSDNRARWDASPLAPMYRDLEAKIRAVLDEAGS